MDWEREWERLNPYQREAVTDENKACLVSANVGSGKTTVLTAKILYLHEVKHVSYRDMVVLTFTNKAASEIRERLVRADLSVTPEETENFGTFHGVALGLLKKRLPVETLGYTKDFMVMEPDEELELAHALIAEKKLKIKYKNRLRKRLAAAERVSAAGDAGVAGSQDDLEILAGLLTEEKLRRNKMTFSDLMKNACLLMAKEEGEEEKSADIQWVIVDEVQDCDGKQLEFIDCFMAKGAKLFAVGDPNQVIYSWRGSAFHLFYTLKTRYQAAELSLPVNYRSCNEILEAARCFQQNGGALEGIRGSGEKIVVKNHYDSFQEACYLTDRIRELQKQGIPFDEIAIFYRLQSQSKVLEDVFSKNGIPYEVAVKTGIHEIPVLEWLLRLLRFLADPADRAAAVFVLSSREYGVGISAKKAEKLAEEGCAGVCGRKEASESGSEKAAVPGLFEKMVSFARNGAEIKDTNAFYEYFDLNCSLKPNAASYGDDKANVRHFLDRMFAFMNAKDLKLPEGLREFLNSAALYGTSRELLPEADGAGEARVKMMTLHASKGLEFSHVFIIGVNYGLIPLRTKGIDGEDEERRLFFVGITRARNYLELSWYTNPDIFGVMAGESRYIRMIPSELVQGQEPERRTGTANLQELRRQVQMAKENGEKMAETEEVEKADGMKVMEEKAPNIESVSAEILVRHETYGCGKVVEEDDTMITVEFDGYGRKEFIKAFSCLEILNGQ
ncbi:ATP-dependent helicase [Hungatella sp.]|uniref:ATP-dependent helicase n=1 Tax=Hungatella sp. TaxID=2613924 RepID=UPI002A7F0CBA|nr:ATP-dependent helicase [Hungatella sp.]